MRSQQSFNLFSQSWVTRARIFKERRALCGRTLQRGMKQLVEFLPALRFHCSAQW
jgi:hypothetical protein